MSARAAEAHRQLNGHLLEACAFKQEHILVKNQVKLRNCTLEPDAQWNWKFKKGFAFFFPLMTPGRKARFWFCERNISHCLSESHFGFTGGAAV